MAVADVYVGHRAVAARVDAREAPWQAPVDALDAGLEALGAWAGEHPAVRRVRVWLAASVCRPFLLPAAATAGRAAERLRIAQAMAPALTGLPGATRVWLDASPAGRPCAGAAIDEGELARILAFVRQVRWRADAIRPWWGEALRVALKERPALSALGVHDGAAFVTAFGDPQGFRQLRALHPVAEAASARDAWARARLSDAGEGPACTVALEIGGLATGTPAHAEKTQASPAVPFGEWARWEWAAS